MLRSAQSSHLTALGKGKDFLGVAATGSGKSICFFVAPMTRAAEARRKGDLKLVRPLDVVLVPFANQGLSHETAANTYFSAAARRQGWTGAQLTPRALYVERTHRGGSASALQLPAAASTAAAGGCTGGRVCPGGHVLVWFTMQYSMQHLNREATCDVCRAELRGGRSVETRGHCATCDWDICSACVTSITSVPTSTHAKKVTRATLLLLFCQSHCRA